LGRLLDDLTAVAIEARKVGQQQDRHAFVDMLLLPTRFPADFSKLIADETEKWAKVVKATNIRNLPARPFVPATPSWRSQNTSVP